MIIYSLCQSVTSTNKVKLMKGTDLRVQMEHVLYVGIRSDEVEQKERTNTASYTVLLSVCLSMNMFKCEVFIASEQCMVVHLLHVWSLNCRCVSVSGFLRQLQLCLVTDASH